MSKKPLKDSNKSFNGKDDKHSVKKPKVQGKFDFGEIIGATNVKRWNALKLSFGCDGNEEFISKLLDIAETYFPKQRNEQLLAEKKAKKKKVKNHADPEEQTVSKQHPPESSENLTEDKKKKKIESPKEKKDVKKKDFDIRKAPELKLQVSANITVENKIEEGLVKIKLCQNCNTKHLLEQCPINFPPFTINDAISFEDWNSRVKDEQRSKDDCSFAKMSLPELLYIAESTPDHGLGVFSSVELMPFTQFGPLIGKEVKEMDVPEDSSMRDIWEIKKESSEAFSYINSEDLNSSNWLRYIRPAATREERNLTVIIKKGHLFFVTIKAVKEKEELTFWQDSVLISSKKKMEKTSCGGCNMTFKHPIYYRTHCSIFHDLRYSLTIRKYHCKVCGEAVLGKENIMKHAAELHNGQGAYQCQFCKKFFLRLNYLEMHRTYGCSANPHRSRPLCDFCGRKFCQPQKLKVHIKRMHSDLAEVLKEFQCKNCLKILGSRAALQRHFKEVHQKQVDDAYSCSRCGKHFQNRSNLKIHMLTHSGIKPFKCHVENCTAAFTTKQCLQFHYKKAHNYNEENMPKIERSIDYTFQAYSGGEKNQDDKNQDQQQKTESNEDSDIDDMESLDGKSMDDPPALQSPLDIEVHSPPVENLSEPFAYQMKILTKGSKKWIGDPVPASKAEFDESKEEELVVEDVYDRKLNLGEFNRHDTSNASLLVEAALDSVCSEPNIDIDGSTQNCTDSLVSNLYTLQADNLDYNEACLNEPRDLMSVNEHISVTDDLNEELRQSQSMGIDYSNFQQDNFSPNSSPNGLQRAGFVRNFTTPVPSPPRYDFGHSSDDSNGMAAQNLSLHSKNDLQLDLHLYKHYNPLRKDFRSNELDRKIQVLSVDHITKNYPLENSQIEEQVEGINHELNLEESKKPDEDRVKYLDGLLLFRNNKFEVDLERLKNYDNVDLDLRQRYDNTAADLDFRNKSYDLIEGVEARTKPYENEDFRADRGFEPLVLNASELQGLDMTSRSFHNYSNINRYHHLYPDDRVDLRLSYSPPTYSHADILRVVSLDLTPPGRHSVDLSLRTHPLHQIGNPRLLGNHDSAHRMLDQSRMNSDLIAGRHLNSDGRLLSDHTTNRILGNNDQLGGGNHLLGGEGNRLLSDEVRMMPEQPRLLETNRLLGDSRLLGAATSSGTVSPVPGFNGYSQGPYHPTPLAPRPHVNSPTSTPYHHYSSYY